jgi:hypothetical protein
MTAEWVAFIRNSTPVARPDYVVEHAEHDARQQYLTNASDETNLRRTVEMRAIEDSTD